MKKLVLISTILISSITLAKGLSTSKPVENQTKFDIRKPIGEFFNKYKDGLSVGLATGSLDITSRARSTDENQNSQSRSENETAQSNFQLQIGYEDINLKQPGFSTFAVYQDLKIDNENMRNMRIAGNATYGITPQAYVFAGLNFSKYYGPGIVETTYKAGIGYQGGVGIKIHERIKLEVEYLTLLNEGRSADVNFDSSAKGILLKLNTPIIF